MNMDNSSSSVSLASQLDDGDSSVVSESYYSGASENERESQGGDGDREGDGDQQVDEEVWGVQFEVVVKRVGKLENDAILLKVDSSTSVLGLKKRISDELAARKEPIPAERQRLIFSGRMLQNDDGSLSELKMKPGVHNVVHLTPLPEGAVPSLRSDAEVSHHRRQQSHHRRRRRHLNDGNSRARVSVAAEQRRRRRRSRSRDHPYAVAVPSRFLLGTTHQVGVLPSATSLAIPLASTIDESLANIHARPIAAVSTPSVCPALPGMVLPLTAPLTYPHTVATTSPLAFQHQNFSPSPNHTTSMNNTNDLDNLSSVTSPRNQDLSLAAAQLSSLLRTVQERLASVSESDVHGDLPDLLEQLSRNASEMALSLRMSSVLSLPFPSTATTTPPINGNGVDPVSILGQASQLARLNQLGQLGQLDQLDRFSQLSQLGQLGQALGDLNSASRVASLDSAGLWMGH